MKAETYSLNYKYEKDYWWYAARRDIILFFIKNFVDIADSGLKVLDYGCGTGYFLAELNNFCSAEGIDKSDEALKFCKKQGIQNVNKLNDNFWQNKRVYSLITLLDVLEHIKEDTDFLKKISVKLISNGYLLLTVPAYNFLWSGEDVISEHVRRYTKKKLIDKLVKADYEIVKSSYFNCFLFPVLAGIILSNKLLSRNLDKSDIIEFPFFINNLLKNIFVSEKCLLKHFSLPFGASIIILAKKI